MTPEPLRVLYLRNSLSINGRSSLRGRQLLDLFRDAASDTLLGHVVLAPGVERAGADSRILDDLISYDELTTFNPNVVYVEGGLFCNADGDWKIPRDLAEPLVRAGAVLVAADVDHNQAEHHRANYDKAASFFGASFAGTASEGVIYGSDASANLGGHREIVCYPSKMSVSPWLEPAYDGVSQIASSLPLCLNVYTSDILATGNRDTSGTLRQDLWVDRVHAFPWATVTQQGTGYAVLIAGGVSSDHLFERCPDNGPWLLKTCRMLIDASKAERERTATHLRSADRLFLSHRTSNKRIVAGIADTLRRTGVATWYDTDRLLPSDSLSGGVSAGLDNMTHFVLIWSHDCVDAPWVKRELGGAIAQLDERATPILIVRLDEAKVPSIVADIRRIEAQDMAPSEIANALVDAVRRLARRRSSDDARRRP